MLAIDSTEFL